MPIEALNPTVNTTWRCDVDVNSDPDNPSWVQVRGLNALQPAVNPTTQDASDYDSPGWGSDAVTQRKWQLTATALRKIDSAGAYDAGQEFLRGAADSLELVRVRWYERQGADGEAYEGDALVQWAPNGGDPTGLNSVAITLLGQGARESIANPTGEATLPALTSASPSGAAQGAQVEIRGAYLTGASAVKFGATNATSFVVVNSAVIVAVVPAGSAGAANITVVTTAGTSEPLAYTRGA
jgi:hypothetical protein